MTRLFRPLLACALLVASFTATAADETLNTLRQQQAAIYGTVREFHMQTLLSGDPVRTAQLKASVEKMRKGIDSLPAKGASAEQDAGIREARTAWKTYAGLIVANNFTKDGYTDDNLIGELYAVADTLDQALAAAIKGTPAGKGRAQADRAHAADLLLQRTVASYLKRSAQMTPDVGSEDSFDVGEATSRLDKQIQALVKELPKDESMKNVASKWNFIRGRLANYNENAVPFIIDRYASQISTGLQEVVARLDGG